MRHLKSLYVQVLIGVALGVLVGALWPSVGASLKPLGDAFIKLVKLVIAPVIFCTVAGGIASNGTTGDDVTKPIFGNSLTSVDVLAGYGGRLKIFGGRPIGWRLQLNVRNLLDEHDIDPLVARRDALCAGLREAGFDVVTPRGSYFVVADGAPLGFDDGTELCRRLPELARVVGVPVSAFCLSGSPSAAALGSWVRFTFVKSDEVIARAVAGLGLLRGWARTRESSR